MRLSIPKAHGVGEEEGMLLEDMAGADPMALGGVVPTDPAEVASDLAEVDMDLQMEGGEYQWVPWQPEQALA